MFYCLWLWNLASRLRGWYWHKKEGFISEYCQRNRINLGVQSTSPYSQLHGSNYHHQCWQIINKSICKADGSAFVHSAIIVPHTRVYGRTHLWSLPLAVQFMQPRERYLTWNLFVRLLSSQPWILTSHLNSHLFKCRTKSEGETSTTIILTKEPTNSPITWNEVHCFCSWIINGPLQCFPSPTLWSIKSFIQNNSGIMETSYVNADG